MRNWPVWIAAPVVVVTAALGVLAGQHVKDNKTGGENIGQKDDLAEPAGDFSPEYRCFATITSQDYRVGLSEREDLGLRITKDLATEASFTLVKGILRRKLYVRFPKADVDEWIESAETLKNYKDLYEYMDERNSTKVGGNRKNTEQPYGVVGEREPSRECL